jgi:predicted PurR-regulated permease PerM
MVPRHLTTIRVVPEELPPRPNDHVAVVETEAVDAPPGGTVDPSLTAAPPSALPRWVLPATVLFWLGFLTTFLVRHMWDRLDPLALLIVISLFLAFAIEPGVNRLDQRGWRRGRATATILFGVVAVFITFVAAIGTLVGTQIAELLQNSETYITDTVDFINDTFNAGLDPEEVIAQFNDPDGPVQRFIKSQQDEALRLSARALGVVLQLFTVLLFTYYLIADGPRLRRAICSRLRPQRQQQVLSTWELAITKTGGYLYSRALLALLSAGFHWVVFQAMGIPAPIPLALWVGFVSQFLPVVGTYLAGILPILITFLDSPLKAVIVLGFIVVYQQIENYFFSPRITARTMELHPAVAFGAALGGGLLLGPVGAVLALPAAAMLQAIASGWGTRHEVIDSPLTAVRVSPTGKRRPPAPPAASPP